MPSSTAEVAQDFEAKNVEAKEQTSRSFKISAPTIKINFPQNFNLKSLFEYKEQMTVNELIQEFTILRQMDPHLLSKQNQLIIETYKATLITALLHHLQSIKKKK